MVENQKPPLKKYSMMLDRSISLNIVKTMVEGKRVAPANRPTRWRKRKLLKKYLMKLDQSKDLNILEIIVQKKTQNLQ